MLAVHSHQAVSLNNKTSDADNGVMETSPNSEVREHCLHALSKVGATADICQFYADVLQCEYDMTHATYRMQRELCDEFAKEPIDCALLFAVMQCLTKRFYHWRCCINALSDQGSRIPPVQLNPDKLNQSHMLKALCSLETKEINMHEGDDLVVTDATRPNRLKVRNPRGEEGYVPALCCILPTPDCNATNAVERLQVHLLTSWTESARKVKSLFFDKLGSIINGIVNSWNNSQQSRLAMRDCDRIRRRLKRVLDASKIQPKGLDLGRLHSTLFSLERELSCLTNIDMAKLIRDVTNLDKAVLCCQNFYNQYKLYRDSLKDAPRPIHIVRRLDHVRQVAQGKNFKYYELKMTLEDEEVTEEITYLPAKDKKRGPRRSSERQDTPQRVLPGGCNARHEALAAEQLTTSSREERQKFTIRSVMDPRTQTQGPKELTLQAAVDAGILVPARGIYRNPETGEEKAIVTAMNEGLIRVEFVTTQRSAEKTSAVGLITIRTQLDHREFTVTEAIDSLTAERIDAAEARARGIIVGEDDGDGEYIIESTGERLPLLEAIDAGWVFVTYEDEPDNKEPEIQVHTYAVSNVHDILRGVDITFAEAVNRGLIDRETGNYINRRTGESVPVADAIQQGLLRAKLVTDEEIGLSVDRKNAVIVKRIEKIRKNVLKGLRVINAFKSAAAAGST